MRLTAPITLAALLALPAPASAQGRYVDIGPPPGTLTTWGTSLSDDGRAAAIQIGEQIYRWQAVGGLELVESHYSTEGVVSADGATVLGVVGFAFSRFFSWTPTAGAAQFSGLGFAGNGIYPTGDDLIDSSDDADVVVLRSDGVPRHYKRSTGTAVVLPFLPSACDGSGSLVVGDDLSSGMGSTAVLWEEGIGVSLQLEFPALGTSHHATGISRSGVLIVGRTDQTAWIYNRQTSAIRVLPLTLPIFFGWQVEPTALTEDGSIVLLSNGTVWTQATGLVSATDYLRSRSIQLPAGANLSITAMTPDGSAFTGYRRTGSLFRAFVAYAQEPVAQEIGERVCAPAVPNGTGSPGTLVARGSIVASDNDVELVASSLLPGVTTLFISGRTPGSVPNLGGGIGTLCIGGGIGRYLGQVTTADAGGVAAITLDLTATPSPSAILPILAGETWFMQAWHRDFTAGGALTSNLTSAVRIPFQ